MRGCVNGPRPMPAQAVTKQEAGWALRLTGISRIQCRKDLDQCVFIPTIISSQDSEGPSSHGKACWFTSRVSVSCYSMQMKVFV